MKAAFLTGMGKIEVKEIPKPTIEDDEVLLRVKVCAICGSDIRIFQSGNNRIKTPHIIGHEISGVVDEIGSNISDFHVGDVISLSADIPCGKCEWCKTGFSNNCHNTLAFGYEYQGGFAEYLVLDKRILDFGPVQIVNSEIGFDSLCLAEPLACAINGLESTGFSLGKSIAIIGAGPIGNMMALLARIQGASNVILVDIDNEKLELASKLSFPDVVINSTKENIKNSIMKFTDGKGVDIVITACPSKKAQMDSIELVNNRGVINFFGGLPKDDSEILIDSNIIHYKELRILGSHGSTPAHHSKAVDLLKSKKIILDNFITEKYGLTDIEKAFSSRNSTSMKIIINP